MGRDVAVSLKGVQFQEENPEPVEVVSFGERFEKNGKTYVVYEEVIEEEPGGMKELVKNTIKFGNGEVDIIKRGPRGTHLSFREGQRNLTCYTTPFGEFSIGISTSLLDILELEGKTQIYIRYDLEINHAFISECMVDLCIMDRIFTE